jgi:hypothetical protein
MIVVLLWSFMIGGDALRWPMVAWMELRERRFWDESTALVARHGLPIYPATREGLLQTRRRLLTEHSPQDDTTAQSPGWHGMPAYGGTDLAGYVELLLGCGCSLAPETAGNGWHAWQSAAMCPG